MAKTYEVQNLSLPLTAFDLSHNHFTTMNMGSVYPVMWCECIPGDYFQLTVQHLIRALPFIAPILNNLTLTFDAYFVPTRLLWKDWEKFITTVDDTTIPTKSYEGTPPTWMQDDDGSFKEGLKLDYSNGSLWRCFGLNSLLEGEISLTSENSKFFPVDFLRRLFWFIYNEWYRDENIEMPVDFMNPSKDQSGVDQQRIFNRAWTKDYFTSGFTSRQKGTAPSIPITGLGRVNFDLPFSAYSEGQVFSSNVEGLSGVANTTTPSASTPVTINGQGYKDVRFYDTVNKSYQPTSYIEGGSLLFPTSTLGAASGASAVAFNKWLSDNNEFNFDNVGTFDVNDLRDMTAIQRFFERLMRSGSRYIEFLQGIYGVSPTDARLSIPERLGGSQSNINISEVLQTGESTETSPQGNQSGHGLGVSEGYLFDYKVLEFGYIVVFADIKPPAVYKQRMPRELMRKTLLDQVNPFFMNLGYQAVTKGEIFFKGAETDNEIFIFQGRYDECREKLSYVSGNLLDKQAYYLNSREFDDYPAYNSDFIRCHPNTDIFAVTDDDQFVCNFYFDLKALRPLPLVSTPGLMDHVYGEYTA